ncbi:hypothetical protein YC2023_098238 [Brassica napus]
MLNFYVLGKVKKVISLIECLKSKFFPDLFARRLPYKSSGHIRLIRKFSGQCREYLHGNLLVEDFHIILLGKSSQLSLEIFSMSVKVVSEKKKGLRRRRFVGQRRKEDSSEKTGFKHTILAPSSRILTSSPSSANYTRRRHPSSHFSDQYSPVSLFTVPPPPLKVDKAEELDGGEGSRTVV